MYVNRLKGDNPEEKELFYKRYRNRLNHILRAAERKHYNDLIIQHKSNIKKTWSIIKQVINKNKYRPTCEKFKHNGKIIDEGKEVSDHFNNFFL